MDKSYFEVFFGNSSKYYLKKLDNYERGQKISFNLAAFFLGIFWFLYRKMYRQALWILAATFLYSMVDHLFLQRYYTSYPDVADVMPLISNLVFAIFTGFFGNWLYISHAKKQIANLAAHTTNDETSLKQKLTVVGGTSHTGVLITLTVILIAYLMTVLVK
jgi:hypothetical protein